MRRAGFLLPLLLAHPGCVRVDPVEALRAAARQLHFRLEGVHPRLDLKLPLDRSGLVLAVDLGVENASAIRLGAKALGGTIHLDGEGGTFPLGTLAFPEGAIFHASSRSSFRAEIRLPYAELRKAWGLLEGVVLNGRPATWRLEGKATLDLMGIPYEVPLRASQRTGTAAP